MKKGNVDMLVFFLIVVISIYLVSVYQYQGMEGISNICDILVNLIPF